MDVGALREEAVALNTKGLDLFEKIQKGEEPFERYEEAEKWIAEAGKKMDLAKVGLTGLAQQTALMEGVGSLTAGKVDDNGDTPPESKWGSFGHFLQAMAAVGNPTVRATLESKSILTGDWETKLLEEATAELGGFLVPIEFRPELLQKAYETSIVRPRATVIPMSVPTLEIPSLDQTGVMGLPDAPWSAFTAGVMLEWITEAQEKPEQHIYFKLVKLVVNEYAGSIAVSNILIADSPISVEAIIRATFGKAAAIFEDWHFLNGQGPGQPWGVIHAPATIQPPRAGADAIVWDDIIAMLHAFQPGANGVWVAHQCTMQQLLCLQDTNNNFMWIPNMRDGMPERLMGYPLIFTEKVPNLGFKGDIGLYDFSYYLIGDRQQPVIDSSPHERFRFNQTTFRISARVDGQPWLSAPVPLMPDGTVSISPFVSLDVEGQGI